MGISNDNWAKQRLIRGNLYTFIDTSYLYGRSPARLAQELCEGGADLIQLRAKNMAADVVLSLARQILPITNQARVPLVINDFMSVAHQVKAPYCHLGQEDFFNAGYRQVDNCLPQGSTVSVGLSTHNPEQAKRAVEAGAAYLGVGPVFATATKPDAKPVTLEYVRWATANIAIPWFAIGGINMETLDEVLAAGARRVCVVSAILKAPNIVHACQQIKGRLPSPS